MSVRQYVPGFVQPAARIGLLALGQATRQWRAAPSFMVIGGQRCGTTTIFKALAEHPDVLRPPADKGTDYYTLHYARGMSWYRSRLPLARSSSDYQAFEACTYYMFHPFAIERIAQDFPDIKLVAMLRDPVARAYSAYKHERARGFDDEPDFMRALELEDSRLEGEIERMRQDVSYESHAHRHHAYRHRGQFAEQLRRVFEHYPREQVHVMQSEAFFADSAGEYARLIDFLGLRSWAPASFEQHNARPGSAMPEDAKDFLVRHYRDHDADLADLLGQPPAWASKSA